MKNQAASHHVRVRQRFQLGLLCAVVGAFGFSGKAIVVKLGYRVGADPITMLVYRMLLALPIFLLLAWWSGRTRAALSRRDWRDIVCLGFLGYYLSSVLDFMGLQFVSASLERLIMYLGPTMVLLLGWALYRKPITRMQGLAMAVSYAGVLMAFWHEQPVAGSSVALGALLVLLSTVSYAFYLTYCGQVVARVGSLRLAAWATSAACLFCLSHFLLVKPFSAFAVSPQVLGLSLINATACTVLPVVLVMFGIERIGAGLTAQLGMIGPMATIAMSALWLGEALTLWGMTGALLVLLGVWAVSMSQSPKSKASSLVMK